MGWSNLDEGVMSGEQWRSHTQKKLLFSDAWYISHVPPEPRRTR